MGGRKSNAGSLSPGNSITFALKLNTTVFNPQGDWGAIYLLAHPQTPGVELRSDLQGKRQDPADLRWEYTVNVRNVGFSKTTFDLDWNP
jgi:hypothetical protein